MDSRLKTAGLFLVSTLIMGSVIYAADFSKFLEALRTARLVTLLPAFAAGFTVLLVQGYVWYSFFGLMDLDNTYFRVFRIYIASEFLNFVTPLGQFGGEPVMAYVLKRNTSAGYEKAFSTVLSADIVNAVPVFTFVLGGASYLVVFGSLNQVILQTVYMSILIILMGGIFVYLLWFKAGRIEAGIVKLLEKATSIAGVFEEKVEAVEDRMEQVEESFRTVGQSPRHILKTTIIAHLGFASQVVCLYFILFSFGFQAEVTTLFFIIVVSALGNFAPTPGGSGAYEGLMAGVITFFIPQVSLAVAAASAIIFRLTTFWPGLIIGYISLNSLEAGWER